MEAPHRWDGSELTTDSDDEADVDALLDELSGVSGGTPTAASVSERRFRIRPYWRKMTWAILIFNVIALMYIVISGSSSGNPSNCNALSQQACNDAYNTGYGIAVGILIFLWVVVDVILGVIWIVTQGRSCPVCGKGVRKGVFVCKHCGHDFRATGAAA